MLRSIDAKRHSQNVKRQHQKKEAEELVNKLPPNLQRAMEVSSEKGASTWLTTLPIADHGFTLHKGAFRDALCLRYGWHPQRLPSRCICDQKFTVEHDLSCHRGGYQYGIMRSETLQQISSQMYATELVLSPAYSL